MNDKQIEFMTYKTALSTCIEPLNYRICSFDDMINYINDEKYLYDILSKLLNAISGQNSPERRHRIMMVLNKLLTTEYGVDRLLSSMLDKFNYAELKHITEYIINNHPDKIEQLCFKFVIKNYYMRLDLSKEHTRLIESYVVANKIIYGA